MQVKLRINLGIGDAKRFGLDPTKALENTVVDVPQEAADEMRARGWVAEEGHEAAHSTVKAVPPSTTTFESMSRDDLNAYAELHKIPGVAHARTKEDAVRMIKLTHPEPRNV